MSRARRIGLSTGALLSLLVACSAYRAGAAQPYQGPIIDTHAHIRLDENGALLASQPIGSDALQRLDDEAGVQLSALIVIASKGQLQKTRAQNDAVIDIAQRVPLRFYPVVSVHPADGEPALQELARVAQRGAKVVKLHPNTQNFDVADPAVAAVVDKCGELGLIVLFDSYKPWDPAEPGKLLLLAIEHPKTRLILAHMFLSSFREAQSFAIVHRLQMGQNVWFDISALAPTYAGSPVAAELVWTLRQFGMDHVLFGSDWPVYTPGESANAVRRLGLTPKEQREVLYENARTLLGLQ